ncbi:hypothetical protein HMPREF1624_02194 [Sporothrix schenckii ATCC 58251]|uniref:Uncharacterized protein n=1 Tax=Sporothrix schenckii (strain ATCC 58251 / de Perez 2211183) TaxID=1391915 RepID=U7PZB0_SPOS1|nr:hypothetical protein HMPREF1624_02194 [Sporothrix schenckii ATCC 58251]
MTDSRFTGPGIFWISSNTNDEAVFPYDDFASWYEDVHIPDVIHADPSQPLPMARRYQAVSATEAPTATPGANPFLVVYKLPTLAFVASAAFRGIPLHHETLPEGGPIARFASFRGRFARHIGSWAGGGSATGALLLSEVLALGEGEQDQPPGDATSPSWYHNAYMPHVAALSGWQRSTRFAVVMENEIGGDKAPPPPGVGPPSTLPKGRPSRWLTLHEFDEAKTDVDDVTSELKTSLMGMLSVDVDFIEVLPYRLVRTYGDEAVAFADGNEAGLWRERERD